MLIVCKLSDLISSIWIWDPIATAVFQSVSTGQLHAVTSRPGHCKSSTERFLARCCSLQLDVFASLFFCSLLLKRRCSLFLRSWKRSFDASSFVVVWRTLCLHLWMQVACIPAFQDRTSCIQGFPALISGLHFASASGLPKE